jgi:hypothetical protein
MRSIVSADPSLCVRFLTDLTVHDHDALKGVDHSKPFVWAVREMGTHLIWAHAPTHGRDPNAAPNIPIYVVESSSPMPVQFYGWDGRRFDRLFDVKHARNFLEEMGARIKQEEIRNAQ